MENCKNSQEYKAGRASIEWWYSLPEEQRRKTDINAEPDIVDAFAYGVLHGWNNPNWISVEERLPEVGEPVLFSTPSMDEPLKGAYQENGTWWSVEYECKFINGITHWMPLPEAPRKEANND